MKNIITKIEREEIYDNMVNLLEKFNYDYTSDAIYDIIDTWAENKADLIEAFKNHPNYVEGKFMIAFDQDFNRKIDTQSAYEFCMWIRNYEMFIYNNMPEEIKKIVQKWNEENDWYYRTIWMPYGADYIFRNCNVIAHQFVNENNIDALNDIDPSLKFKEGMKMSRAVNKICTWLGINKLPDYNREFAKYADSVNPLKITRHTVISINPIDYLTMSFGNSWASCHTIDKDNHRGMPHGYEGQYSSGTMSYMLDQTSMVFYTVDADYDGNEYYFQDKINRCMFHYGKDKLIQGRVYPQNNDRNEDGIYKDIREIAQRVLSTCLNVPNYWDTKRGTDAIEDYVFTKGTHYNDYLHFNNCCISFLKEKEINYDRIVIGHKPICIECGCEHNNNENINHCKSKRVECENCGCLIDEDDARYIDGDAYCEDCACCCDHCDTYHVRDDVRWLDNLGLYVCDECLEEDFTWCEECESYHRDYHVNYLGRYNRNVCDRCLRNHYTTCDRCDEYVRDDDFTEDAQENVYCEGCWEIICSEEENENEEAM